MEGAKICKNCGHKKIEHLYVWGILNEWVCPVSFFIEDKEATRESMMKPKDLTKDIKDGILNP